jgi:hypothetical protein
MTIFSKITEEQTQFEGLMYTMYAAGNHLDALVSLKGLNGFGAEAGVRGSHNVISLIFVMRLKDFLPNHILGVSM